MTILKLAMQMIFKNSAAQREDRAFESRYTGIYQQTKPNRDVLAWLRYAGKAA